MELILSVCCFSFAELDSLVLILSKIKESKTMSRAVKAGVSRESGKPCMASLDCNGTVGIGNVKESGFLQFTNNAGRILTGPSTSTPIVAGSAKLEQLKNLLQTERKGTGQPLRRALTEEKENSSSFEIVQKNPKWFRSRPFLSWDYPCCGSEQLSAPIGNLPPSDQERFLVEELLYVLSGFDGDHIHALPIHSEIEERKFSVDESNFLKGNIIQKIEFNQFPLFSGVDESLKEMVQRFFPIMTSYSVIQRFYETRCGFDHGMVNDALAAAVGNLIHDYRIFICQLESLLLKNELSLQKTWYLLQPNVTTLYQLHHVTISLMKAKSKGGQVLSVLHQQTLETMGNDKQQKLLLSLTRFAVKPYWQILQKWIYQVLMFYEQLMR